MERRTPRFLISSICIAAIVAGSIAAKAQSMTAGSAAQFQSNPADGAANVVSLPQILSSYEFWLSSFVLALAVLVIALQFMLFIRRASHFDSESIIRLMLITLIILVTAFFVAAGFDSKQIAPAIGLFGTIAGYLLGKESGRNETQSTRKNGGTESDATPTENH